jgi:hypothetical protein
MFATLFRKLSRKSQNVVSLPLRTVSRSTRLEVEALEERSVPVALKMLFVLPPVAGCAAGHLHVSTTVHARKMVVGGSSNVALRGGSGTEVAGGLKGESASVGGSIDPFISRSSGEEIPQ